MNLKLVLDLGDIRLGKDEDSGNYYIRRIVDNALFDLNNNWKSNQKNKYMTTSTKNHIIQNIFKYHINKEGVKEFKDWYIDKYTGPSTLPNVSDTNNILVPNNATSKNEYPSQDDSENITAAVNRLQQSIQEQNDFFKTQVLGTLADRILSIKAEDIANRLQTSIDNYIKNTYGTLPTKYEFVLPDMTTKTADGIFHKELPNIMKFITADIPLILVGPAGSGKNFTLEKAAENLGFDFYFTNAVTQEYKLTGFIDAHGVYQETQFYKAFKDGGVFFLDEIDASVPEALIILNAAIANKYFDFPNGRINAHPDFRVVAAANTYGTGSDMIYVGRNVLDGATLDRFAVLNFDYDERVEVNKCPDNDLYQFISSIRDAVNKKRLRFTVSIRAMINSYKMLKCGFDKEYIIKTAIVKSMTKDDINSIKDEIVKNEWYIILKNMYNL